MDIAYIVLAIYALRKESDPYAVAIRGLRGFSICITIIEIAIKVNWIPS